MDQHGRGKGQRVPVHPQLRRRGRVGARLARLRTGEAVNFAIELFFAMMAAR